jgi:phospholipid/cholesterol/gamma-HCH transport system substrate-binding protein
MKLRASNLMIGSATLAVVAAAFAGFLAFQKIHGIRQQSPLRIVFEGSASGLRKGGSVNFDGIQIGQIKSLKLDNPRKVVALAMVDSSAPIRKDTVVGLEFQGLTGIAAISLVGGAPAAPSVPLDEDGIPVLTADLSETEISRPIRHRWSARARRSTASSAKPMAPSKASTAPWQRSIMSCPAWRTARPTNCFCN